MIDAFAVLTASGDVLGTLGFIAPEQLRGGTATAASDQFSFCVALHRTLHGAFPVLVWPRSRTMISHDP